MRYIKGDIIEVVCGSANRIGDRFIFDHIDEYNKNCVVGKGFDYVVEKEWTRLKIRPFKNWIKYFKKQL